MEGRANRNPLPTLEPRVILDDVPHWGELFPRAALVRAPAASDSASTTAPKIAPLLAGTGSPLAARKRHRPGALLPELRQDAPGGPEQPPDATHATFAQSPARPALADPRESLAGASIAQEPPADAVPGSGSDSDASNAASNEEGGPRKRRRSCLRSRVTELLNIEQTARFVARMVRRPEAAEEAPRSLNDVRRDFAAAGCSGSVDIKVLDAMLAQPAARRKRSRRSWFYRATPEYAPVVATQLPVDALGALMGRLFNTAASPGMLPDMALRTVCKGDPGSARAWSLLVVDGGFGPLETTLPLAEQLASAPRVGHSFPWVSTHVLALRVAVGADGAVADLGWLAGALPPRTPVLLWFTGFSEGGGAMLRAAERRAPLAALLEALPAEVRARVAGMHASAALAEAAAAPVLRAACPAAAFLSGWACNVDAAAWLSRARAEMRLLRTLLAASDLSTETAVAAADQARQPETSAPAMAAGRRSMRVGVDSGGGDVDVSQDVRVWTF